MTTGTWLTISLPQADVEAYCTAWCLHNKKYDPDEDYTQEDIDSAKAIVTEFETYWEAIAELIKRYFPLITSVQFWEEDEDGHFGEVSESGSFSMFDNDYARMYG